MAEKKARKKPGPKVDRGIGQEVIAVRLFKEQQEAILALAVKQRRSYSDVIRQLIERGLAA